MDYLNVHMPEGLEALGEDELRREMEFRRSVHMLRANAANAMRGLVTFEPAQVLQPKTIPTYFNEMLEEACTNPVELARRVLLEQVLIGKHLVSHLALEAAQCTTVEASAAYSAAVAKLQGELRRNVKCLAEVPAAESLSEKGRSILVESEMIERYGEKPSRPKEEPTQPETQENARDSEQGSKQAGRQYLAAAESPQSAPGRSGPTQPYASQGSYRGGAHEAPGLGFTAQAMDKIFGPANAPRQAPGRKKRPSRKNDVKTENRPRSETPEETARRHAEITRLLSGMVPVHIGGD